MTDQITKISADNHLATGFVQIPISVLLADISPGAKVVYAGLCYYWWRNQPYPGHDQASADWSIPRRSLQRYFRELQATGLVQCRRQGQGWPNHYHLPQPRLYDPAAQDIQTRHIGASPQANMAHPTRQIGAVESLDVEANKKAV